MLKTKGKQNVKTAAKVVSEDDNFIMSPKFDFVFKYIFGNEKNKDLLIALLSAVLGKQTRFVRKAPLRVLKN